MQRKRIGFRSKLLLTLALLGVVGALPAAASVGPCTSDIDGNGTVDLSDLTLCLGGDPRCDINRDSAVACFDVQYVLGNFGRDCTCLGDVDGDGFVDLNDLNLVLARFGSNDCATDIDKNGQVDSDDVDALLCVFGTSDPFGDVDRDGDVDFSDLSLLLGAVTTPPLDCRADVEGDINGDGVVDGDGDIDLSDLAVVLGQFGQCP
jgi:hypothetical protein